MTAMRYAILGAGGQIAKAHLAALAQLPEAQIVGLVDVATKSGAMRAAKLGVPFFAEAAALLDAVHPDVVVICTPHPFHAPLAVASLRAGAHVLVEKPMAVEVAEADAMIVAAEAANRVLAVNFQHRFDPAVEAMRRLIEDGQLGALIRVECEEPWYRTSAYYRSAGWRATWAGEGGGVLMNQAIHTLDTLCYLVGQPVKVLGWVRTLAQWIECEDTAQAMLEYPNGALGTLQVSTVEAGAPRRLRIAGERASLELLGDDLSITRFTPAIDVYRAESHEMFGTPHRAVERVPLPPPLPDGEGHVTLHRDLLEAITTGRAPRCDGVSGRLALELANAILLSSFEERALPLPLDRAAYSALLADLRAGRRTVPGAAQKE